MHPTQMDGGFVIVSVLVFIAVMLLLEGLYLLWNSHRGPQARKVAQRLRVLSAATDTSTPTRLLRTRMLSELPGVERILLRMPRAHRLDRLLLQANLRWTVSRFVLSCVAAGMLAFALVATLLHQELLEAMLAGAGVASAPLAYVIRRRALRLRKLEMQLPDALDLLMRALRAGHALGAGLQMIGQEMTEPIASEFRYVHDEINFGVSLEQALNNLGVRVPSTDLRYFIVAVLIQRESGGNLTEVLANLSRLIRERFKLHARIRILSAEGRLSAWILSAMPFALAALLNWLNPAFMAPLWQDPIGLAIVRNMLILMAFGIIVLRRITHIHI